MNRPTPLTTVALNDLETAAQKALPRWRASVVRDPPWGLDFGRHCSPSAVLWLISLARIVLNDQQELIERKVAVRKIRARAKIKLGSRRSR